MRVWIALIMLLMAPLAPASENTDAAVTAASQWLRQIDNSEYPAAYSGSSTLMRSKVAYEPWLQAIDQARKPLGMIMKRELIYGALEKEIPGLARGEYAKLRFRSYFGLPAEVTEHVTLMRETDGQWRAIGYFIE